MSEEPGPPDPEALAASLSGPSSPASDALARVEREKAAIEEKLHEERFLWALLCIILADAFLFTHIASGAGAVVIGLLQLVLVVVLAERCRVNAVWPLIDRAAGLLPDRRS